MSAGVRVDRNAAFLAASRLVGLLSPASIRVDVAGSIRRNTPDVGDIELVAIPRIGERQVGLFGTETVNYLTETLDYLIEMGELRNHPTDPKRGERYSKLLDPRSGLQVDLFSTTLESFGMILLIRTGPADYSRRFVTDLRRRGLHAAEGQLHRGGLGCGSYVCEVVPTPDEEDVFRAAGWPYIRPEHRA